MKESIFSKVLGIFFVAFFFVNNVFYAKEELPQRVVYVDSSLLIKLIKGYERVMAEVSRKKEERNQELQKKYNEVASMQGELDDLRKVIKAHEDDIDFVDPATGMTLSDLQIQLDAKNKAVTDFQIEMQRAEEEMNALRNKLLAPIISRYNSILEAFINEKKETDKISYMILDKSGVASSDAAFDITDIIKERIKDDNERRERNIKNNAAGEPVSEKE